MHIIKIQVLNLFYFWSHWILTILPTTSFQRVSAAQEAPVLPFCSVPVHRDLQKLANWIHDYAITHSTLFEYGPLGGVWTDCSYSMALVRTTCPSLKQMREKFLPLLCPCPFWWFSLNHQSGSYVLSLSDLSFHAWAPMAMSPQLRASYPLLNLPPGSPFPAWLCCC